MSLFAASTFAVVIDSLEDEFYVLWNDPAEQESIEKQVEEEEVNIEKDNKAFKEGKFPLEEQLNPVSLISKNEFKGEKTSLTI